VATPDQSYFAIEHVGLEDGVAVIALHGELDAGSSRDLGPTLALLGLVFGGVIVDLSDLAICDTAGLTALRDAHGQLKATRARLTLRRPPLLMRRILAITGLDELFDVEPVADDGVGWSAGPDLVAHTAARLTAGG
jgi:anti-sigma B factor antagonist